LGKTDYKVSPNVELIITPLEQIPILVKIEDGIAKFKSLQSGYEVKGAQLACTDMMIINNTLYLKNGQKLIELNFRVSDTNILPAVKTVWTVEPLSSQIMGNVIYQSVLGKFVYSATISR
jgi:hypothetical protein